MFDNPIDKAMDAGCAERVRSYKRQLVDLEDYYAKKMDEYKDDEYEKQSLYDFYQSRKNDLVKGIKHWTGQICNDGLRKQVEEEK